MNKLPDVIHVGFSKCASTFLRSFFLAHPQAYLVSDAHFFVPVERRTLQRGTTYYESLFARATSDQLKVESDEHIVLPLLHPVLRAAATTLEAVAEVAGLVKQTVPDAKIILIIRNQVDLILSRYGEYVMSGRDIDFGDFVNEFLCCSKDKKNYFQNYYAEIIEILHNAFTPQNVLILLQEELYRDEATVIVQLCDFLGIEPLVEKMQEKHILARIASLEPLRVVARSGRYSKNTGLSLSGLKWMRLWNRTFVVEPEEAYYRRATARVPYIAYKSGVRAIRLTDYYMPRRIKGNKKALLTPPIISRLRGEFSGDNRRLGELLDKDIGKLGY